MEETKTGDREHDSAMNVDNVREAVGLLDVELLRLSGEFNRRNRWNLGFRLTPDEADSRNRIFRCRDSVGYRAGAILWHVHGINLQRELVRERFKSFAESMRAWSSSDPREWWAFNEQQFYRFDDVIFNIMSMLDYLANLVGASRRNGKKFLWTALVEHCRKSQVATQAKLARLIVTTHDSWVEPVNRFRGELIHQNASEQKAQQVLHHMERTVSWEVWLPDDLKRGLPGIFGDSPDPIDVVDGAIALAHEAIASTTEIVRSTWDAYPGRMIKPANRTKAKLPK